MCVVWCGVVVVVLCVCVCVSVCVCVCLSRGAMQRVEHQSSAPQLRERTRGQAACYAASSVCEECILH